MLGQTSLLAFRNRRIRKYLIRRHNLLVALRSYLTDEGFIEVDTPIIRQWENPIVSLGVLNKTRLHLRACLEDYTRRCACAFGKVFEIGKCFRNEEIKNISEDGIHLPEFTMAEIYEIDAGLDESLERMESMLRFAIKEVLGTTRVIYQRRIIRFDLPFRRLKVLDAIIQYGGTRERLFAERHRNSEPNFIPVEESLLKDMIEKHVIPHLFEPTFLTHFPKSADQYPDQTIGNEVLRAELFIAHIEIGEVGCLQPDASKLEEHLKTVFMTHHGSKETEILLEKESDFLKEIQAFNRKVGGGGIGIDRLLMLLCDTADIKDVVWYPSWKVQRE